jgi:metallo-beta-lactamase class B
MVPPEGRSIAGDAIREIIAAVRGSLLLISAVLSLGQSPALQLDPPITCSSCDEWNQPREPFPVFGNTYYVGTAGLSAVLVTSDDGHVLLDGGLTQSAPVIDANIRKLGFRTEDIKLIVNSHEHYDHAAGIAALQRASGATVAASPEGARALELGASLPHDPQPTAEKFPPVKHVKVISDGETLRVGRLAVTAHFTPGHTPGATTWTWRSCEGARCLNVVYADSLSAVSDEGFRFSGDGTRPSIVETFRRSFDVVGALPCDVLLVPHPFAMGMDEKRARQKQEPAVNPFVDAGACKAFAARQRTAFEARLASEKK